MWEGCIIHYLHKIENHPSSLKCVCGRQLLVKEETETEMAFFFLNIRMPIQNSDITLLIGVCFREYGDHVDLDCNI